jgi:hypothetical protein
VIDAIRDAFAACELAYPQTTLCEETTVTVFTHLRHSSGESMVSPFRVPVVKRDPQGFVSATTYARRAGLMAMAGVAADDDDANEHSADPKVRATKTERTASSKPTPPDPAKTSKLVAAFAGLGVSVAMIEERLGHALGLVTEEELTELRAYYAKKKEMASADPDVEARRIEAEKAEVGILKEQAAVRAQIDARMLELNAGPVRPDAVERTKMFSGFVDRIRAATSVESLVLLGAEFGQAGLTPADAKALQRTYGDRLLVLQDATRMTSARKLTITDVPA